jgi:hypothetical protein
MWAALAARSLSRWPTPNFLTCSLWPVNMVIAEERLLLWRSRTRPTRATSGMGASTQRPFKASHAGVYAPADSIRTNRRLSASPMIPGQAIRNTRSAIVPSVIREIEIWRVAVLMVDRYADEAEANSFMRAMELAAEGDHAGAAIWRRVTVAIEQLSDTTGPPN